MADPHYTGTRPTSTMKLFPDFTSADYWDERFREEETNDWLLKYHQFSDLVDKYVNRKERILMLGCGNSKLSLEMYQDGYHNIVNVDFSQVCIERMREKHTHCPLMQWMVMDIKHLTFPDCSFDIVLDKGTLDALVANERDPWSISDEAYDTMEKSLTQVSRILKPGGRFLSITFSQPHFRRPLLARSMFKWDVQLTTIGEHFHFFFFVMEKGKEMSTKDKELERDFMMRKQSNTSGYSKRQFPTLKDEETEQSFLTAFTL